MEIWQHLEPYAESLEEDSKTLGRLQGKLTFPLMRPCAKPAQPFVCFYTGKVTPAIVLKRC